MALAKEFAVFNRLYSSVPGPSWPNHMYILSATSAGCTETGEYYQCKDKVEFPQKTIVDSLDSVNLPWRHYYNDSPHDLYMASLNSKHAKNYTVNYNELFHHLQNGKLPAFGFINCRGGVNKTTNEGSNDDHPPHDVALGERLLKDLYEAVRASPQWNSTVLLVTWDDPGGYYDHYPTPLTCPPPDNIAACSHKFKFDRLGIRVPGLLISPWVEQGTVINDPDGPEADSKYDLTSFIATTKKLFSLPKFLTKRDAWAGTFESYFAKLSNPRTDCPMHLPAAPPPSHERDWSLEPVDRRQKRFFKLFAHLNNVAEPNATNNLEATEWLVEQTRIWKESP